MDDSISRQAAIDAVNRLSLGETDAVRLAMRIADYLIRMPSVQPEPKWILCSERLPDMCRTYYLVSLAYKKEVDIAYFTEYGTWETFRNDEVETWMPLPEPYKGEQE